MIDIRKILAMAVVIAMACASLVIVSPNNTVTAEDSARPLSGLDSGFPAFENVIDQSQMGTDLTWPIMDGGDLYGAQGFQVGMDGDLSMFEFELMTISDMGGGQLGYDIREGSDPGLAMSIIGGFQWVNLADLEVGWNSISLDTFVEVIMFTDYQIVLTVTGGSTFDWNYDSNDFYPSGTGKLSANDFAYGDLGGDWTFNTYMAVPTDGLKKVTWHESGDYALGIATGTDHIYKYTRNTMTWASEYDLGTGDIFNDIEYSEFFDLFYIVGEDVGSITGAAWSYYEPTQNLLNLGAPNVPATDFNCLGLADEDGTTDYAFLAMGEDYAQWYDEVNDIWIEVTGGLSAMVDVMDVTWDHGFGIYSYWAVGDMLGEGYIYKFMNAGDATAQQSNPATWGTVGPFHGIEWQPAGASDHAIIVGENTGDGNVWSWDGTTAEALLDTTDTYTGVSWHPDGSMAMLVGYNGVDEGVIYHYIPDNNNAFIKMSTDGDHGKLYGVDVKAWTSPSSGLIVGSSGAVGSYLSASDGDTTLTVNAAFPHMYTIDMWKTSDAGETSTLNARVDAGETYTFYTEINYTIGGTDELFDAGNVNNTFVDLTAWFDDGNDATSMTPSASDDSHRTRKFVARFYEGTAGTGGVSGSIIYPDTTTNEILLDGVGCSGPFGGDDRYGVWINVTFGAQMRAADGQNFVNGAAGSIFDSNQAFDDDDSWNFQMQVYDNDFPGATNSTYEEFGIFMSTNITVSNNPSVNAPPGSVSMPFDSNSLITYSANIPYYVNVSIERLNLTTDDSKFIPAASVNASLVDMYPAGFDLEPYTEINSTWGAAGRPFAAANAERMVWGNTSQATELVPAPNNGTAAHGPIYSNFDGYGATEVSWWVSVPGGTDEGIYQASITFKIGYY